MCTSQTEDISQHVEHSNPEGKKKKKYEEYSKFYKSLKEMPSYVCINCNRLLFRKQVVKFLNHNYVLDPMMYPILHHEMQIALYY